MRFIPESSYFYIKKICILLLVTVWEQITCRQNVDHELDFEKNVILLSLIYVCCYFHCVCVCGGGGGLVLCMVLVSFQIQSSG